MKAKRRSDGKIIDVKKCTLRALPPMLRDSLFISGPDVYHASDLDFSLEKETVVMEGWIARDEEENGRIYLFQDKPTRNTDLSYGFWDGNNDDFIELPTDSFPSVTWQSEPKKVRIVLTPIDE